MKAINTYYKGYFFRSRLEARWAVYFDELSIKKGEERKGNYKFIEGYACVGKLLVLPLSQIQDMLKKQIIAIADVVVPQIS